MSARLKPARQPLAYTIPEAADASGVGETVLRDAIERGDIPRRYPSTRPVVLASDLLAWLEALPHVSPRESA